MMIVDGSTVNQRGYGTNSEYVRELIRRNQDRQKLRGLLLAGAAAQSASWRIDTGLTISGAPVPGSCSKVQRTP